MRVLINHLTRMRKPYVCVAGIRADGAHVRPVLRCWQLNRALLQSKGGHFSLGAVVDLGSVVPRPTPPEVEDVVFVPDQVKLVKTLEGDEFRTQMAKVAKSSLQQIFGDELGRMSRTAAAVPEGRGKASLGVLRVNHGVTLHSEERLGEAAIRCTFRDRGLGELSLKVTDLRLWKEDQITPDRSRISAVSSQLAGCMLSVGLTRARSYSSYPGPQHWLQVNNVFPDSDPLWRWE